MTSDPLIHMHEVAQMSGRKHTGTYIGGREHFLDSGFSMYDITFHPDNICIYIEHKKTCHHHGGKFVDPQDLGTAFLNKLSNIHTHKLPTSLAEVPEIENACIFIDYYGRGPTGKRPFFGMHLRQERPLAFVLESRWYSTDVEKDYRLYDDFSDIDALYTRDFRPYLHRLLEICNKTPKKSWHSPDIYMKKPSDDRMAIAKQLLPPEIFERFCGKNAWPSIPTMNIGVVKMPSTGMKLEDKMVEETPYLIEQLAQLGIMRIDEAEEFVTSRLITHFLQRFQTDKKEFKAFVNKIRAHHD